MMKSQTIFFSGERMDSIIAPWEGRKVFLVRGSKSYVSSGAKDFVESAVYNNRLTICDFYDFSINPKKIDVDRGVSIINKFRPSVVLAIGGGSVIDMAKLIRYYSDKNDIPLIAVPTTAGTGAESTQFAVCYVDGVKQSISHDKILPDIVLLRPQLTYGLNKYLTACTGFDALAQAIEAYWNVNATNISDSYAMKSISYIYPSLLKIIKDHETPSLREKLVLGANFAGRAINITRTTVPHALSYVLTTNYGYPHGHAVALTFPFWFNYNIRATEANLIVKDKKNYLKKMSLLLNLLGLSISDDLFVVMKKYTEDLGLGYNNSRPFDNNLVAQGINIERAKNNPTSLNHSLIRESVQSIKK